MLRIADMSQGLQYGLSQDGVFLYIHMARDFAREAAPEVGKIAYGCRSKITNKIDIEMLGDFIPYKEGRPWGYGACLQVDQDGDVESWKLALPAWQDGGSQALECIQLQSQAFMTLESVFAAINVPTDQEGKNPMKQRVEVDLHFDHASGGFFIKAELAKEAIKTFSRLTKTEFKYIRESMALAVDALLPHIEGPYRSRIVCAYSTEKPLWFSLGDAEFAADGITLGGGCRLSHEESITLHQAFGFLIGLTALDESLRELVTPLH